MELQDKPLDPSESLQLIQKFITGTRHNARKSAFGFIFWGALIALAALLQYSLVKFSSFSMPWLPWPVLMVGGFIFSAVYYSRGEKKEGMVSTYGHFFKWLFFCGGVIYFLLVFLSISQQVSPVPFVLALTSLLLTVAGLVMRYRPVIAGGILFFLAAIASIYLSLLNQLLLLALCIILGYLVPGILLSGGGEK